MKKGNLGISLTFYPVVAFVLAIFGQWLMCLLVLGLAMLVEKDEWTTRQCMQAFFLGLIAMVSYVVSGFINGLNSLINRFYSFSAFSTYSSTVENVLRLIAQIVDIGLLVLVFILALMSIIKVAKGQEANTPIVSKWAYKAYGYVQQVAPQYNQYGGGQPPYRQQPPMGQPGAPVQQPPMGQPGAPGQQPPAGGVQPPPPPPQY